MAERVSENLKKINDEIRGINSSAKATTASLRDINKQLKADPTNIELINKKYQQLNIQVTENIKKQEAYNKKLAELKKTDTTGWTDAQIGALTREIERTETVITRLNTKLKETNAETLALSQKTEVSAAKYKIFTEQTQKAEAVTKKLSLALLVAVAALGKLITSSVEQANELYSLSKRYDTSVESIQKYNNILYAATLQTDLYTQALSFMTKGMAQFAAGRGVAYAQALRNIGLNATELAKKTTVQQYEAIFAALQNVSDATERAAAAQTLFGDSGMYIAEVAGLDAEAYAEVVAQAQKFAIISNDNADALANLGFEWEAAKSQIQVAGVLLATALLPLLIQFTDFIKDFVVPALKSFADFMEAIGKPGQTFIFTLLTLLIILPKLITVITLVGKAFNFWTTASQAATVATAGLNVVTSKWRIILLAVAAALLAVVTLVSLFSKSAREATQSITGLLNKTNEWNNQLGTEFTANTQTMASSIDEHNVHIDVSIYGEGDTAISDAAASDVATLTAEAIMDKINKTWGGSIK